MHIHAWCVGGRVETGEVGRSPELNTDRLRSRQLLRWGPVNENKNQSVNIIIFGLTSEVK